MFTIKFDNLTIYDPRTEDFLLREPEVHLAVGEPGSVAFTLDADHPSLASLTKLKGVVELQEDGSVIYRGRIVRDTKDFNNSRRIETEGLLACLHDSVIAPFKFPDDFENEDDYLTAANSGNVVEYFLSVLLGQHNAQVSEAQQIQLGTVTVEDPNNYISRSSDDYSDTWSTIHEKLVGSSLGGYLLVRYEDDGTYLDYYDALPLTNVQTVEFAENLLDLLSETDATELFTVILPVGKDGLTIESLPDGEITADLIKSRKTIYSVSGVAAYGRITRTERWDDVTEASNLRSKAAAMLGSAGFAQTITVQACDLHGVDGTASFRVGRMTRLVSEPHDFAAVYPLMELDIDILDPGNTAITLGRTETTQTDFNKAAREADAVKMEQLRLDIRTEQAGEISGILREVTSQITAATQSSQAIIFEALEEYVRTGDLDTYKSQIATQFQQTATQIQLSVVNLTEQISDVNGDLQQKIDDIKTYFRFTEDGLFIGKSTSPIVLKLINDRIAFLSGGDLGIEVAYWKENKFFVRDAKFLATMQIGEFGFFPRPNGSLSFKKVT